MFYVSLCVLFVVVRSVSFYFIHMRIACVMFTFEMLMPFLKAFM